MHVEIAPDPEERGPLVAAVEALLALDPRPACYRSAWRERGIRENVDDAVQSEPGRPPGSPGGPRA